MAKVVHPSPIQTLRSRRANMGFSMLEVLIAFLILSVGLLGAVGMQATALKSNREAKNHAVATSLARELADKMRGNHTVAIKTAVADNPYLMDVTLTGTTSFAAPATGNCFTSSCGTATAVASWDVADWQARTQNALPDPRLVVCFDSTPFSGSGAQWACSNSGDAAVLKMAWTNTNTGGTLTFSSDANLKPMLIVPLTAGTIN